MKMTWPKTIIVLFALTLAATGATALFAQQAVEKEPNNSADQANPLALNGRIEGFGGEGDDQDWYSLTIPAPGLDVLIIEVAGPPDVELALTLCDASGKEITEMDANREEKGETIVRLRQPAGKFLIKVSTFSAAANDKPYTLTARKSDRPPATPEEVRQALLKALGLIASRQQEDGSWPDYEQAFAGLAIQAFIGGKCAGKDYSGKVQAGLDFLRSKFTSASSFPAGSEEAAKNGGLFGIQGANQMYQQAIATLGVIEGLVDLNDPALEPVAEEAVELIIRAQNTEAKPETLKGPVPADSPHYGSWRYETDYTDGDISVSAWQILTLRAAVNAGFTVPERVFTAAAKFVRSLAGADGSFSYEAPTGNGESCARAGMGALSLQLCGAPKDPLIAPAIRFIKDHGPVWNLEYPGDGYPFYYWYYATRVMYMVGGEDWRVWKDFMCRFLVDHQSNDGSWEGARQEESPDLDIYRTAFGALMLEFCCGHVPVYMSAPRRKVPASVAVAVGKDDEAEAARTVEIIMDASNSMTGTVGKETKIAAARRVLTQAIEELPDTMNVGLRVYGHRYATDDYDNACRDTELVVPIGPIQKAKLVDMVNKIQTKGRTPLVASVLAAIKDLEKLANGSVVLVTDGIESCKGDVKSIAPAIKAAGLEIKVNIVGFDIREAGGRQELESIAASTGGRYIDARNAGELLAALGQALKLEYVALDAAGKEVGRGAVGGEPVKLAPGNYTIRILLAPQPVELKVAVKSGEQRGLTLKKTGNTWILE
jgi:hypothetical protein